MPVDNMTPKQKKTILIVLVSILGAFIMYLVGFISQWKTNAENWKAAGGLASGKELEFPSFNIFDCYKAAFTGRGLGILFLFIVVVAIAVIIYKLYDKFNNGEMDERGFKISKNGTYGTAKWMKPKEMKEVYEVAKVEDADGTILGEYNGEVVCMPEDYKFNKHVMILGASGTKKSRAIIRNSIFQSIKRGESAIITDPKGELYDDTVELYKKYGYDVKVFNLVTPIHGDGWNCMSDLNGETLMASVLTNVIIGNTSSGKGDHFWDNAEMNLLKALILYVSLSDQYEEEDKNLATVYHLLVELGTSGLESRFRSLSPSHPALAPYHIFSQAADNVKQGVILGLGTRLQILQDTEVKRIVSQSDIDLTAPAWKKCAYFIVTSDQDSTMAFLSSLFFSCLFIKLTRYADAQKNKKCPITVNIILDEFNNIGRIGSAADGSDFTRTLSTVRSRDMRIMIAVQSLGQLQNRYPNNLWAEIIGNCDIQLMLGCTDDVTAEYISGRSGEISINVDSTRIQKRTIALMQLIPQYQETQGEGKRMLLTPDEVLRLPNDYLLVITRSHNMLKLKKYDFTNHPMSKEMVPASLMDYDPSGSMPHDTATVENDPGEFMDAYMALMSSGDNTDNTETATTDDKGKPIKEAPRSTESVFAERYGDKYEISKVSGVSVKPAESDQAEENVLFEEIEPPEIDAWSDASEKCEAAQSFEERAKPYEDGSSFVEESFPNSAVMENVDSFVLGDTKTSDNSSVRKVEYQYDREKEPEISELKVDQETGEILEDDAETKMKMDRIFNGKQKPYPQKSYPRYPDAGVKAKKVNPKDLI